MKRLAQSLATSLEACSNVNSLAKLHSIIIKAGHLEDTFYANKLIALYTKLSHFTIARKLFDELPHRTVFTWNSILKCYNRDKRFRETLCLFSDMGFEQKPDHGTILLAMKACVGLKSLKFGKMIHGFVKKEEVIDSNLFVGSGLIDLYSRCGVMSDAVRVFEEYSEPDVVLWTMIVTGYEQNGWPREALGFFARMVNVACVSPDQVTLISVVSACAQLLDLKAGRKVHGLLIKMGFDSRLSLVNALLNLYAKTGSLDDATCLFRIMEEKDVISWGSMISCYAHNGAAKEALDLLNKMIFEKVEPNAVIVISALQACEANCNLKEGKKIHQLAIQKGLELDILVSTALIDMYMNCSSPSEAVELFYRMPIKDEVVWSTLLCGCVQNGMAHKSMAIFCNMLSSGVQPDGIAMVKILTACSELGIIQQTLCLHGYVVRGGFENNSFVEASLIESYSKCGSLDNAIKIFDKVTDRDVVIWSSMIAGYGIHGQGREALDLFHLMVNNSLVKPNSVTFLSVLSACSHAGLIEEGICLFEEMVNEHRLTPDSNHYAIVVDLLGRTGELEKAMEIINLMPKVEPHVWGAFLGACTIHHKTELGEVAARNLLQLHSEHAGYYILMSNIYAADGKWDNVAEIRNLIKQKNMKKVSAVSMIEANSEVHSFVAGDRCHPTTENIYMLLKKLELNMVAEGYVPNVVSPHYAEEFASS
ncbi:Pentatricopeptide repeat-containing protein [Heracleum sosnowskyi]|uniref:Pentatricopeptide repeat-containing protein n=1 Tax=Heracleum sosnowskyi TaxID=360622 RepID=A0AAD8NB92_9APIA|nr:Pentatricopeptide repeat-containing protein [Heracleum sosnowskyi]